MKKLNRNKIFDKERFIQKKIIDRDISMFKEDLDSNSEKLYSEIKLSKVLVIGGAGSIGCSFIKSLLKYEPEKVIVVDTNENGLTELVRL